MPNDRNYGKHSNESHQLMELNVPLIIGLNMVDVATQRGIKIQFDQLMKRLKIPMFPIVAIRSS